MSDTTETGTGSLAEHGGRTMTLIEHDPHACTRVPCGRCRPHVGGAPPIPLDPHQTQPPPAPPDATVRSIGLPRHPALPSIAEGSQRRSEVLMSDGDRAVEYAALLASRGYAATTLGDGGSRGTDATSSTERNGGRYLPDHDKDGNLLKPPPDAKFRDLDVRLAVLLRDYSRIGSQLDAIMAVILQHADDADPVKSGTGQCRACNRSCEPTGTKPGNRIRKGLCPTCYRAWRRYKKGGGMMIWPEWVSKRLEGYTERDVVGRVVKVHTPEPDHDLDLSRETA